MIVRKIQLRRGVESTIPVLSEGEPGFTTDSKKLFVGSDAGNIEIGAPALVEVTWQELKDKRDAGLLTPGQQYRITDYECTTTQASTQSAGHQFDIIVTADDVDKLNESARACLHEGDIYFANSKLEAWQLKYCLDNDTSRFAWADSVNGKGVIYRMIDEFNNDVPYDFKNIQYLERIGFVYNYGKVSIFHRNSSLDETVGGVVYYGFTTTVKPYNFNDVNCWLLTPVPALDSTIYQTPAGSTYVNNISSVLTTEANLYTFSKEASLTTIDLSLDGLLYNVHNNTILAHSIGDSVVKPTRRLNNVVFVGWSSGGQVPVGSHIYRNFLGFGCSNDRFSYGTSDNYLEFYSDNSSLFGFQKNKIFGGSMNRFGSLFSRNLAYYLSYSTFGDRCEYNTFDNGCSYISFGSDCSYNTFGSDCRYLQISNSAYGTYKKYIHVENGTQGASSANKFDLYDPAILNKNYQVTFKKSASGKYLMLWATDTGTMTGKVKATATTATWSDIV